MERETLFPEVRALLDARQTAGIVALSERVSPAAWADIIPSLDTAEVITLVQSLPEAVLPEVLADLAPAEAATILRNLTHAEAASVLGAMALHAFWNGSSLIGDFFVLYITAQIPLFIGFIFVIVAVE